MAFASSLPYQAYLFRTDILPEQRFMPEVGNGHIATAIFNPFVHMNGLYDGETTASSRARIPSLVSFKTAVPNLVLNESYELNVRQGIFAELKTSDNDSSFHLTRETFAHRLHPCLLITRLLVTVGSLTFLHLDNLHSTNRLLSEDIDFAETEKHSILGSVPSQSYFVSSGTTKTPEVAGTPKSPVTVAWYSSVPLTENISVGEDGLDFVLLVSVSSSEKEATDSLLAGIRAGYDELRSSHVEAWSKIWENGRINVDPEKNFNLAQTLCSSLYYLMSSLPNAAKGKGTSDYVGLSPGGLAHGAPGAEIDQDYLGHSFWDTEMWMFPPILFFHPDQARILIEARMRTFDQAKRNAVAAGKEGAKFPWESAFTGVETTPWSPAADFQLHVNGDIAFAVRQFLYASPEKAAMVSEIGLDQLVEEIAAFWQSCTVNDDNNNNNTCSLNGVMGPDEYHYPVNNSAFTNFIAQLSLKVPGYVLGFIGKKNDRLKIWAETAKNLPIRTVKTVDGREFHPEFDEFEFSENFLRKSNVTVKQADVILLGYPLDMEMSREIRQADLDIYREITNASGPAMTWSMFAVGYLELGKKADADELFSRYSEHSQPPFGVWSEVPGGDGAVNFLTGMGGFLQSVINGYGGFRLRPDHLAFDPVALPNTTKWSITGAKYLGYHLDFVFDFLSNVTSVTVVVANPFIQLVLETLSGHFHFLKINHSISFQMEKSRIKAV